MTDFLPEPGIWVEKWLGVPRFARYLESAHRDRARALALYEWNACLSAAVLHDLAHLEVGLRNAYDRVLTAGMNGVDWTEPTGSLFAPLMRRRSAGLVDVNEASRRALAEARRTAGPQAVQGKIVAELMFGFWRYLSSAAHEKRLWVPHLHRAFPPGTRRRQDVDEPVTALNRLRNRAAHHEPLLQLDVSARHRDLVALASLLDRNLGEYIQDVGMTPGGLKNRP